MKISCHSCGKQLKLSENMVNNLKNLGPGKTVRIKCPACTEPIILDDSVVNGGAPAPRDGAPPKRPELKSEDVKPPSPPDITWLEEGEFDDEQVIEDIPLALVLMDDQEQKKTIIEAIESIGYKTELVKNSKEAMEKMQFVEYSSVVLHCNYEGKDLTVSPFHKFMCDMAMTRRRFIFYTLIGPQFSTLYNLQALVNSANLVVNDSEIAYFNVILRKAIPEYEELFGPITEELRIHGK